MRDLQERIRESRPAGSQVPPLDVDRLRGRARRRQLGRAGGLATLALAVVVGTGLAVQGAVGPTGVRIEEPAAGGSPSSRAHTSEAPGVRDQLVEVADRHQEHLDRLGQIDSELAAAGPSETATVEQLHDRRQALARELAQVEERFATLLSRWHATGSPDGGSSEPPKAGLTVHDLIGTRTRPAAPSDWEDVRVPWVPDGFTRAFDQTRPGPAAVRSIHYVREDIRSPQGLVISIYEPDVEATPGGRRVRRGTTMVAVRGRTALVVPTTPSDPDDGLRTLIWEQHDHAYLTVTGRSGVPVDALVDVANQLTIPS